jgi:hypothetical protein
MAVIIESSYGKTIGLPGYSSHKFSLSLQTEVGDLSLVAAEAERVYGILQSVVDTQMAQPGWVPNGNGESHAKPSYSAGSKEAASHTSTAGARLPPTGAARLARRCRGGAREAAVAHRRSGPAQQSGNGYVRDQTPKLRASCPRSLILPLTGSCVILFALPYRLLAIRR